jgi:hypothetical protein
MEKIKHLKIETATHIFPKFTRMQRNVFDSCMHSFFCAHRRGAGGATDSLVQSALWVELGCRGDRPELPLIIGSPGLPLLPAFPKLHLSLEQNMSYFAITRTLFGQSHRPPFATYSAGKNLVRAG